MTKAILIKGNIALGLAYSCIGSGHCHHGGKPGSVQAGMVQEEPMLYVSIRRQQDRELKHIDDFKSHLQ